MKGGGASVQPVRGNSLLLLPACLPDYAIIGNHFHARLEQRAAIWPRGSIPSAPSPLPARLPPHLGTWLFVFQRKGKLHKSEQLNFFRAAT